MRRLQLYIHFYGARNNLICDIYYSDWVNTTDLWILPFVITITGVFLCAYCFLQLHLCLLNCILYRAEPLITLSVWWTWLYGQAIIFILGLFGDDIRVFFCVASTSHHVIHFKRLMFYSFSSIMLQEYYS